MAATLLRLRLALLRGTVRRDPWRLVLLGLGGLWVLTMLPSLVLAGAWLRQQPAQSATDVLVVLGSIVLVGWFVVPVLLFGVDDALDPRQFATFAVPTRRLVPGLLLAACVSVPALFAALLAGVPLLGWSASGPAAVLLAVSAVPVVVVMCVLAARLSTALGSLVVTSRRARFVAALLGAAVLGAVVWGFVRVARLGLEAALERVPGLAELLSFTPLGAAWAAPGLAASGDVLGGVVRLLLAVGYCVLGAWAWGALVARLVVRPAEHGEARLRRHDRVLEAGVRVRARRGDSSDGAARARRLATAAVAARSRRGWARDPRYVTALVSTTVMVLLLSALVTGVVTLPADRGALVLAAPILAGLLAWGRHNDAGFDGTALWAHVVAPVAGLADRVGRVRGVLVWMVPALVVISALAGWSARSWEVAGVVLCAALGFAGAGLGVASVMGVVLPYPVQASGESPFAAGAGSIMASAIAQLVASLVTWVLSAPLLVVLVPWLTGERAAPGEVVLVGLVTAGTVLVAGLVTGGTLLDRRWAAVLDRVR